MEKIYDVKLYLLKYKPKVLNGQIGLLNNYDSELANELSLCITEEPKLFDNNMIGIFNILSLTNDYLLGSYGCCPSKDNESVINVDYKEYKETSKQQASTFKTLFYIDIKKSLLMFIENRNVLGLKSNLEKLLKLRDINLSPIFFKNWKDRIVQEIQNISYVEFRNKDNAYVPSMKDLDSSKTAFICTKLKIKCKPKEFVEYALANSDNFEMLNIKANNKTYDFINQSLKAIKKMSIKTIYFSETNTYKVEIIDKFVSLSNSLCLDGNILLE